MVQCEFLKHSQVLGQMPWNPPSLPMTRLEDIATTICKATLFISDSNWSLNCFVISVIKYIEVTRLIRKNILHITFERKGWCFKWFTIELNLRLLNMVLVKVAISTYPN